MKERKKQGETETIQGQGCAERLALKRRLASVPPPDSDLWPQEYRGKRWKRAYALLFAGKCLLCQYSCQQPRSRRMLDKWAGLTTCLLCINHPSSPGELREMLPTETCRNFKPKHWGRTQSPRPKPEDDLPSTPATSESDPEVRRIPLGHDLFAIVDAADYEELSKYTWHLNRRRGRRMYVSRQKGGKAVYMHREIMHPPEGYVVDHIDHNRLNHSRCNLRVCTRRQNQVNMGPRGGSSRFVGVTRRGNKWQAGITVHRKSLYLGMFDDEVEAAKARDRKAYELHGPYAYLNFPEDYPPPMPGG